MRKLLCIVLAVALTLSLSIMAYAQSNGDSDVEVLSIDDMVVHTISPDDVVYVPCVEITVDSSAEPVSDEIVIHQVSSGQVATSSDMIVGQLPAVTRTASERDPLTISPYASARFEFDVVNNDVVIPDTKEYVVKASETTYLKITNCVWAPEHYNIEVGFVNTDTWVCYGKTLTGGSVTNSVYGFSNLPAGTYYVYAMNLGDSQLTTGYMLYNVY